MVASFFEHLFRKKAEIPAGGLVEYFHPAAPPALSEDLFEILAPLPPALPARRGGPQSVTDVFSHGTPELIQSPEPEVFEILAPMPAPLPPRTLTEAFFPEGPPPPRPEAPRETGAGFFDLFTEERDPWDIERERRGIPSRDRLDRIVGISDILRMVKEGRKDPDFQRDVKRTLRGKPPAELPLIKVAEEEAGAEGKVAAFLGIPPSDLEHLARTRQDPWVSLLNPLLYGVERGLEWYLGDKVPGVFHFGVNDRGEFGLFYLEDHPDL